MFRQVTKPTLCESIAALQPTEVAAGEQTIFIISDGKVYAAGGFRFIITKNNLCAKSLMISSR